MISQILFLFSYTLFQNPQELKGVSFLLVPEAELENLVDIRDWMALDNQLFVTSFRTGTVGKVNLDSLKVEVLAGPGPGPGEFSHPSGVHATADYLYVVDTNKKEIVQLHHDGKYVAHVMSNYYGADVTVWKDWLVVTNALRPYSKPQYLFSAFHRETNERKDFLSLGDKFFKERPEPKFIFGMLNLCVFSDLTSSEDSLVYASVFYLSNYFKVDLDSGSVEELPLYAKAPMPLVFGLNNLEALPNDMENYRGMSSVQVEKNGKVHVLSGNTWKDGALVKGHYINVISEDGKLLKKITLDRSFKLLLHLENYDYYLGLDDEDQLIYKITVK